MLPISLDIRLLSPHLRTRLISLSLPLLLRSRLIANVVHLYMGMQTARRVDLSRVPTSLDAKRAAATRLTPTHHILKQKPHRPNLDKIMEVRKKEAAEERIGDTRAADNLFTTSLPSQGTAHREPTSRIGGPPTGLIRSWRNIT